MIADWHDINDPGFGFRNRKDPKPEGSSAAIADNQESPSKDPLPVEYKIKYVRAVEPANGFRRNKAYDIEGEIEPLVDKITQPRIVLYPVGIYKATEDDFFPNGIEAFPDKDGSFRVTCNHLFNAAPYDDDAEKPEDATWTLLIRAQGRTAEKDAESEPLTLPQPQKTFTNLRKGHYDDNGARRYDQPQEGTDYVQGDAVKLLQQDLISLRFLPKGEADGFFGGTTDAAVRDFQQVAIDHYRMPVKLGKLIEAETTLQQSSSDGIVGPKTRDEIDLWKKNEWVKPAIILRHGDYDDEGVNNRKGERGGDDHHIKTPVKELQRGLKERGFDNVGAEDGWFWDKTKDAILDFQTCAAETTRVVNGEPVDVDVTFTGKTNGIFDEPTQQEYSLWQENDYHAPEITESAMIFAAPGMNNGEGGWFVCEDKDIDSLINEVSELDNLQVEIQQFRESCKAAEISEATTQKAKELEEKVAEKFKGLTKKPADAIQELLLVKSNSRWGNMSKRVYIRPYQTKNGTVGGHWRKNNHATVEKALKKWLKQGQEKGDADRGMDAKLKGMLWESEKLDEKWPWEFKTLKGKKGADTAAGYFEGSYEAQFFRFVAGANADSEFNLKEMQVKLTASANASYSLAQGTVSGQWSLPGQDGFNLFEFLVLSDNAREAIKQGRKCPMRITTKATGKAFSGAAITATVGLPCIDLSRNDKAESGRDAAASAGVSGDAFAGASAEGKIASMVEWQNHTDTNPLFDSLAEVAGAAGGSAGIGAGGKFEIKYENGKIRFEARAMGVVGLGGKAGCAFELGVDEGIELLAYLYNCIDFHRMDSVAQAAFEVYLNVAFMQFVVAGKLAGRIGESISSWLAGRKGTDDGLKQTKQTIYTNLNDNKKLQDSPPEALGELLQTITEFPRDDDFNAILKVLESAEGRNDNAHKLKWIIRSFHDPELSRSDTVTDAMKTTALEEGIAELMGFGRDEDELETGYRAYLQKFRILLRRNGIIYE